MTHVTDTSVDINESHELELIEQGPTLVDYVDLIIKAVPATALVVIAGRLG